MSALKVRANTIKTKLARGKRLDTEVTWKAVARDIELGLGLFSEEVLRTLCERKILNAADVEAKKALKGMMDISNLDLSPIRAVDDF